jgi:copper chaperone CopZ
MSCGHCVNAVTSELDEIPGVDSVSVDLVPDLAARPHDLSPGPRP